ncbi:MAG: hypothetical protein QOF77_1537 [Solirubrobacteraceae bacterium]|jgi:predicted RNA-binding Zn ribbon-like protein|nr:hypothetical protein [Solirubrobacteraceae bacterium]
MCYTHVVAVLIDDLPPEELAFRWSSGRLCLDLVATVGERWRRSFERLRSPEDLARWLAASLYTVPEPPVSPGQLAGARELREAINRLARPGTAARPGDRHLVNRWAAQPSPAPKLTREGRIEWTTTSPVEAVLAAVARDAVDLLGGPLAVRVRECAAEDCALLFLDASRPGRRRWCATDACGNRARTRAYRHRHRHREAAA